VRVNVPNSGAGRRFWLYNRRFDGTPSDTMFGRFGFKTGTTPKYKAPVPGEEKNEEQDQYQEKIMSIEPAALKMLATALRSSVKRHEKRGA